MNSRRFWQLGGRTKKQQHVNLLVRSTSCKPSGANISCFGSEREGSAGALVIEKGLKMGSETPNPGHIWSGRWFGLF